LRTYELSVSSAIERLNRLGDAADDVALALWISGRKGRRGDARACPIAVDLKALPGGAQVEITVSDCVEVEDTTVSGGYDQVSLPDAVRDFIIRFDNLGGGESAYPELEAA
jgi:hypothetical protein